MHADRTCEDRVAEEMNLGNRRELASKIIHAACHRCARLAIEPTVRLAHGIDRFLRDPAPRHLDVVVTTDARREPFGDEVRRNVARLSRHTANKRACSDRNVVVERRRTPDGRGVTDTHVSREERRVRNRDVVPENAIVCDVHANHQKVAVSKSRHTAADGGTSMNRHLLTNVISVADFTPRLFAAVLPVLRRAANGRERGEDVVFADAAVALENNVAPQDRAAADGNLRTHDAPRAYDDIFRDDSGGIDDGSWVNRRHRAGRSRGVRQERGWGESLDVGVHHHEAEFRFGGRLVADDRPALEVTRARGGANVLSFENNLIARDNGLA